MLTVVVSRAVLGRRITIAEAWRDSRPQLLRLLGLLILIPLLVSGVVMLCLLPGLLAALTGSANAGLSFLFLAPSAAASPGPGPGYASAFRPRPWCWKSRASSPRCAAPPIVRGNSWRILAIQLFAGMLVIVISFVVQLPTSAIATLLGDGAGDSLINGIGSVLASAIALSLSAGITALLYLDQRIRRESLDLKLAHTAGVPGYQRK